MTDVAPDVTARFTPEAAARFAEYLAHTRADLDGCAELSPDDVEDDIRAHVDVHGRDFCQSGIVLKGYQVHGRAGRRERPAKREGSRGRTHHCEETIGRSPR